jgi:hypothetical protein
MLDGLTSFFLHPVVTMLFIIAVLFAGSLIHALLVYLVAGFFWSLQTNLLIIRTVICMAIDIEFHVFLHHAS